MRRAAGLPTATAGVHETSMLRAAGRLLHVDDAERLETYREILRTDVSPNLDRLDGRRRRLLRMLVASLTPRSTSGALGAAIAQLWEHPQVRNELIEMLSVLPNRIEHRETPLDAGG